MILYSNVSIFFKLIIFILINVIYFGSTFDVPCTQKLIGQQCLFDEECYGINSFCRDNRCSCPTNFEEYDVNEQTRVCRPAPSKIGDSCQRDCKPPLLCRDGKCECWGGSIVNGKCVVACPAGFQLYGVECTRVAHWNQKCEKDSHCVDPFNACLNNVCLCAPGTVRDNLRKKCIAVCPDGQKPKQSCRRLFINDIDMLENAASTDSCPSGYRCSTYGSPYIGHCCKLKCPYGEPDLTQSCDNGVPENEKCRALTHFCYTISEPGWKSSLCCPRPCRNPTPLYLNGRCVSLAHRDDACQIDQQCEGGTTMQCVLGVCDCRMGYKPNNDDRFPTCEKICNLEEIAVGDRCLTRSSLGERCISDKQCPNFSECRFGVCQCSCGYRQTESLLGPRCSNPEDPLSLNTILSGVEELFGNRGRDNGNS
uniref:EB domain-containing protein n=1 Tax=Strongyloides stercoralis TaxID=6248 RepID=A0A0K0DTP2_STRER